MASTVDALLDERVKQFEPVAGYPKLAAPGSLLSLAEALPELDPSQTDDF